MRLLFVAPFVPDRRAPHGGGAYVAQVLAGMAPLAELGLVALQQPGDPEAPSGVPLAWSLAVPRRRRRRGLAGLADSAAMAWRWRNTPLVAAKAWDERVLAALARAVREFRPDVAFVEMAQMAQYLPALAATPTVLTDHEAGCPANTRTGLGPLGDARDRRLWRRHVLAHYPRADAVQAVTAEDAAALSTLLGRPVRVRPIACEAAPAPAAVGDAPPRALFLGDYQHQPNPEAAARLCKAVLPRIRAVVPDAELWLAGPHAERIAGLGGLPGVRIVGFVPSLPDLFANARLALAPVWSGGGFRMKALTALAHGVPLVTNALGARGCGAPDAACVRAETDEGLASAAIRWLVDPAAAAAAGRAAHAYASSSLTPNAIAVDQLALARRLVDARAAVRA
jgi:glycosyltransferase involved in cell wall biosynthesis